MNKIRKFAAFAYKYKFHRCTRKGCSNCSDKYFEKILKFDFSAIFLMWMIFFCSEQENIQILGIFYSLPAIFSLKSPLFYGLFINKSRLGHLTWSLVSVFAISRCYFSFRTQNSDKNLLNLVFLTDFAPFESISCQSFGY